MATSELALQIKLALSVLKQFMAEMQQWEQHCLKKLQRSKFSHSDMLAENQKDLDAMNEIFAKYCTPKKRIENHVGAYGDPTEYNPEIEKIVDTVFETKSKIIIYTEKEFGTCIRFKRRYTLLKKTTVG